MEKIFVPLFNFFQKRRAIFYTCLALSFLITGFFASKITLEEDIASVIPKDSTTQKINSVLQNSKFLDRLVIYVSLSDNLRAEPDSLVAYAGAFVDATRAKLQPYIASINDKVDDEFLLELFTNVQEQLPVYLDEEDYKTIDSLTQPAAIRQTLSHNIELLSSPSGLALKKVISNDPSGISFIALKKLQQLQFDENFELYDGYILTKDKKHLLFFISPKFPPNNTGKNLKLLKGLNLITDSLKAPFPTIQSDYYGATAVSAGNALQIRKDNLVTQGIAVLFIIAFVAWYFRKKAAPFMMLLPVVFGALFSLSVIYFIKGKISVIALGTGSVVLGIAINYSLHVFNHYRHTRDIREALRDLSMPMTIGSFTTIGGFFCLQFVKSELLKDVGLFAAFSLVGASIFSLVFLPHLILSKKILPGSEPEYSWLDKISLYKPERNKWIIAFILLLTAVFIYTSRYASFETDMMKMNYMTPRLKQAENEVNRINAYALQSVYLVSSGNDLQEALKKNERVITKLQALKQERLVEKYSGISPVIISDSLQESKILKWNQYWSGNKKAELIQRLQAEGTTLGYSSKAFNNFKNLLEKNYQPSETFNNNALVKNLFDSYVIQEPGETMLVTMVKTTQQNKQIIYDSFKTEQGISVIDKQHLTNKLAEAVKADFTSIAIMSSLLVFIVLLITYGRIELALATFIPMLLTWVWILGIMGLAGIKFNIINIIISTLIFGLGDDYSIFIMDGLLQEYKTGKKLLSSYKSSIFISAITTISGLGVLIFARHPALKSIALISIIGISCVVMMAQVLIPFFFNLLVKSRVDKGKFPWTAASILKSAFAFTSFLLGCLLMNIIGLFMIVLNPFKGKKTKYAYHFLLSKFSWSLMYVMTNLKKKVINNVGEKFETPCVLVANHQSFLDILMTVMLHPKLILLTNSWVYHSPFFGNVVRMAGYYPVKEGAEQSIDILRKGVANGYSIVIFPEGTRSRDGRTRRFHKGAFFLAEQLNIDILPLLIHGSGYTMGKSDFMLKDGKVTLEFLPRIKQTDSQWGFSYSQRTKNISSYFRKEYDRIQHQLEDVNYFRETLHYNYLYKGPVLEWYQRIKVNMENNYSQFNGLVPSKGSILDIGCGYGFLCYMLYFVSKERRITGIDYDEEKIATANHCFSKTESLNFHSANALSFEFGFYDCIILSDVLHYLQPAEQESLVEKSIGHLNPGGVIIIREGNAGLARRHKGTQLTEIFSTRLLGFNKTGSGGLSFLHAGLIHTIAGKHNMECMEIDTTKLTSNIIFVVREKAAVADYGTGN